MIKRFHTTMELGEKRKMTPEGFLVCLDVPMARTGEMLYGPDETPVPSADGVSGVRISRDEDEVFKEDTILSMIGKPVTSDHPEENVTPDNYGQYSVGHVVSARRGEGVFADLLLGDIMITNKDAIRDITMGKREVSAGYDADYEETAPGVGRQKNIYYNHLALVDKGRCGPRCAIGDYQPEEIDIMAKHTRKVVKDHKTLTARLAGLFRAGKVTDADIEKVMSEETSDDIVEEASSPAGMGTINITMGGAPQGEKPIAADDLPAPGAAAAATTEPDAGALEPAVEARFQGIENAVKQIAAAVQKLMPEVEETAQAEELAEEAPDNVDAATMAKAKDSAFFQDSFNHTVQMAEIIVPGVRVPSFVRDAAPKKTLDALCSFRRTVLDLAYGRPENRSVMEDLNGGRTVDAKCMTCDKIRSMFRSLGVARAATNNSASRDTRLPNTGGAVASTSKIKSPAELNVFLAERRKARQSA